MEPRQWGSFRNLVKFGVSGIEYVCMYIGGEGVRDFRDGTRTCRSLLVTSKGLDLSTREPRKGQDQVCMCWTVNVLDRG